MRGGIPTAGQSLCQTDGHVLFTAYKTTTGDPCHIKVVDTETGDPPKSLHLEDTFARYLGPGYLLYVNSGNLHAVHFDLIELEVVGPPTQLRQVVAT